VAHLATAPRQETVHSRGWIDRDLAPRLDGSPRMRCDDAIVTSGIIIGLIALGALGSACAAAEGGEEPDVDDGAVIEQAVQPVPLPPLVQAIETARALDRSAGIDAEEDGTEAVALLGGGPITVSGRVLQLPGASVSSLPVAIIGQGAVLTDDMGNFTIPDVTPPYDIVVGFHDSSTTTMVLYAGLVRPDPRLLGFVNTEFSATVDGTVSGGVGYPEPPSHASHVAISTEAGSGFAVDVDPLTGAYFQSPSWAFDDSTIAHLTAVQYQTNAAGLASNFTGAETGQFPLSDGASVVVPAPLLPVATTTLSGTYTVPPGYTFRAKHLNIETPNFALITLPADPVNSGTFALNAPVIADRSNMLVLSADSPGGGISQFARRAIPPGTSGLAIDMAEAVDFIFPFDGSTGIDHDTMFLTTEFPEGVYLFQFSGSSPSPSFVVVTDDPAATIPDLSVYGVSLPPSASYFVSVVGLGRFADLEEFAGPTGPLPSPELILTSSAAINVTTAP
jgi:hypothetical protein